MGNPTAFMRPKETTHEEIQNEIKSHQEKVQRFEDELVEIKLTFSSQQVLSRPRVAELKKRRRALGVLKDRHQEKIRELKQLRRGFTEQ